MPSVHACPGLAWWALWVLVATNAQDSDLPGGSTTTLRHPTDSEILDCMSEGPRARRPDNGFQEVPISVPPAFWTTGPDPLAPAFVDANRTEEQKRKHPIAYGESDDPNPPAVCAVAFSYFSSRCGMPVDHHFFLRCDPQGSYLTYAASRPNVNDHWLVDRQWHDLRHLELAHEDARQIAHTLWWLNQLRCSSSTGIAPADLAGPTIIEDGEPAAIVWKPWSSDDGIGVMSITAPGDREAADIRGTLWGTHSAACWNHGFDEDGLVSLAHHLLAVELPNRLGKRWSDQGQTRNPAFVAMPHDPADPAFVRTRSLHCDWARRVLSLYTRSPEFASRPIALIAARLAGDHLVAEARDDLVSLFEAPDRPKPPQHAPATASAQRRYDPPYAAPVTSERLRTEARLALRKIRSANDADALEAWVLGHDAGVSWASDRLRTLDEDRYISVLERCFAEAGNESAASILAMIDRVRPQRAVELARDVPPDVGSPLMMTAINLLRRAGAIDDERAYVGGLIQILLDSDSSWSHRYSAIEILVPTEEPNRFSKPEIDAALVQLVEGNEFLNLAAWALARRDGSRYFDTIHARFQDAHCVGGPGELLSPLAFIVQQGDSAHRDVLAGALRAHLQRTNRNLSEIMLAIWSADLTTLADSLRRIATANPQEVESNRSGTSGGEARPVDDRFHLARQILAMWDQPDAATRAKLVIAFAHRRARDIMARGRPERLIRLKRELAELAASLSTDERAGVRVFLQKTSPDDSIESTGWSDRQVTEVVKGAFGWSDK